MQMESLVLQALKFRVCVPSSHTFLSIFLQMCQVSAKTLSLATYLTVCPSPQARACHDWSLRDLLQCHKCFQCLSSCLLPCIPLYFSSDIRNDPVPNNLLHSRISCKCQNEPGPVVCCIAKIVAFHLHFQV